mmetsp:Transcript_20690/g.63305  ORF Transcript_20690/g.63305 Transcript_20690/m.63305 type:complete len:96 (+) Transcript_20690:3035-3322(+)
MRRQQRWLKCSLLQLNEVSAEVGAGRHCSPTTIPLLDIDTQWAYVDHRPKQRWHGVLLDSDMAKIGTNVVGRRTHSPISLVFPWFANPHCLLSRL